MATPSEVDKLNVTIKTANGSAEDLKVDCERQWCLFDLKVHLSNNHPSQPPVRSQKLICNGRIVPDESTITSLMGTGSSSVILHLVISPAFLRSNSLPARATPTTTAEPSQRQPVTSVPVTTPTNQASNTEQRNNELRFRQPVVDGSNTVQAPQYPQPNGWPNPYMMSPYYAAQMAHWYQMMYNNNNTGAQNYHHINPPPVGVPAPPPQGGAPPQEAQQQVPNNNNNNINNDGGFMAGGMAGGMAVAENRQQRDLVDYAYMLMMLFFLGTMGYIAGSLSQFIIFGVGVAFILLNQGGWFRLQRRQVAPPPPPPAERDGQQGETETDGNNDGERQDEGRVQEPERGRGIFATMGLLITSFFTSLVPQQIPELEEN